MQALHLPPTESSARQSGRMEIFTMGTNSEFCSDERVGYTLLKSFLAGDVNANRCYAGLSPEEQQRLVSGTKSLRTPDEVASYVWDYLDRQGR